MPQTFHRSTNTIARLSIYGALFLLAALAWFGLQITRSSYVTQVNVAREQPVPFSHKHHVAGLGIDCRYCHTSVEDSAFAGIPPTETCMSCHSQIWVDSPMLEAVRESYRSGRSLEWTRVHDLADFAYFNHSIHVDKGIGCDTCHGRVDLMPLTWRVASLQMEWCLECHRAPEDFVRPVNEIFNPEWSPPAANPEELGHALVEEYDIARLDDCAVCHR